MPRNSGTTVRRGTKKGSPYKNPTGTTKHEKMVSGVTQDDSGKWTGTSSHKWARSFSKSGARSGKYSK